MATFNGHKNWNHWNVSLWINNDEGLYRMALSCRRRFNSAALAAEDMRDRLVWSGTTKTPDGAPYSKSAIRAAMVGM